MTGLDALQRLRRRGRANKAIETDAKRTGCSSPGRKAPCRRSSYKATRPRGRNPPRKRHREPLILRALTLAVWSSPEAMDLGRVGAARPSRWRTISSKWASDPLLCGYDLCRFCPFSGGRIWTFRATVALCRALLEDVVKQLLRTQGIFPIRPDNIRSFRTLLNSIPSRFWSNEERDIADKEIKDRGDAAMHEGEARFTEDEAWRTLVLTTRLIQALVNRGGLQDRKAQ